MTRVWGFFLSFQLVFAIPHVTFPFNSQVPQLARVGDIYSFTLSPSTFKSDTGSLRYALDGSPPWLVIDAQNRTLFGIPDAKDVGTNIFNITATDSSGSVAMESTLLVENSVGPYVVANISKAIAKGGELAGPSILSLLPSSPFTFDIPSNLFVTTEDKVYFYATLNDHTPLPAWLNFDPNLLQFNGVSPLLNGYPQEFQVILIVSDVVGFAAREVPFTIRVSYHELFFKILEQNINLSADQMLNVQSLRRQVTLDGGPITDADYSRANITAPSWIKFDSQVLTLSGIPPPIVAVQDVTIEVHDRYGDVAIMLLHLNIGMGRLIVGEIGPLNVTKTQDFRYEIDRSTFKGSGLIVQIDLGVASNWLHFDPGDLTISGRVPANISTGTLPAKISASTEDGSLKDFQQFNINIGMLQSLEEARVIASFPNAGVVNPSNDTSPLPHKKNQRSAALSAGLIAGIVLTSVFAVFCVVFTFLYCKWMKSCDSTNRSRSRLRKMISPPFQRNYTIGDGSPWILPGTNDVENQAVEHLSTTDRPPQLQLSLSPAKLYRRSITTVQGTPRTETQSVNHRILRGSAVSSQDSLASGYADSSLWSCSSPSWRGIRSGLRGSQRLVKLGIEDARDVQRVSAWVASPPAISSTIPSRRRSQRRRCQSNGLPVNRPLPGLGHGRGIPGPVTCTSGQIFDSHRLGSQSSTPLQLPSFPMPPGSEYVLKLEPPARDQDLQRHLLRRPRYENGVVRPVSRRGPYRSPFFAGRTSPKRASGASWKRYAQGVGLGLSTIDASPDLGSEEIHGSHHHQEKDPFCSPKTSHGCESKAKGKHSRTPTADSGRDGDTTKTTAGTESIIITESTSQQHRQSSLLNRRWSTLLHHPRTTSSGGPRPLRPFKSDRYRHHSRSVGFSQSEDDDDHARNTDRASMSSSVYSQSAGDLQSLPLISPLDLRKAFAGRASGVAPLGAGGDGTIPEHMPIMERPRASYRLGAGQRTPLRRMMMGGNGREGRRHKRGKGKDRDENWRNPAVMENDGDVLRTTDMAEKESLSDETIRGNEAFL